MGAAKLELNASELGVLQTALSRLEVYGGRMDAKQMLQIGDD
ncbi:hypothetical protein [Chryseobacterium arthrosphaerae]